MLSFELSERAQKDLENIWDYTYEKWSRNQANKYFEFIQSEIREICLHPDSQGKLKLITRSISVRRLKSHLIFFKIKNRKIFIIRILHKNMDLENHL